MSQIVAAIQQDNGSVLYCKDTTVYPLDILNPPQQMYKTEKEKNEDWGLICILREVGVMKPMTHDLPLFD